MEFNIEAIEKVTNKIKKPKRYKAIMFNDDVTTMEFVVTVLVHIFNKSIDEANKVMLNVHNEGHGIAGIYSKDIAKSKVGKTLNLAKEAGYPFKMIVEEI